MKKIFKIVIALVVLGIVLMVGLKLSKKKLILSSPPPTPPLPFSTPTPAQVAKLPVPEDLLKQPWGRNPFSEFLTIENEGAPREAQGRSQFVLTGIVIRGEEKAAIINRHFVREGDSIDSAKVLRILKDRVLLEKNQEQILVRAEPA